VNAGGVRLLDPNGIIIAGRNEVGLSLAHLEEVSQACRDAFSASCASHLQA